MTAFTTSYHPTYGAKCILNVPTSELLEFRQDASGLEVTFHSMDSYTIAGFVPEDDLDDKDKYWKTEDLISQIEGLKKHYEEQRDQYRKSDSGLTLALKYNYKALALHEILVDLIGGSDIWEYED